MALVVGEQGGEAVVVWTSCGRGDKEKQSDRDRPQRQN